MSLRGRTACIIAPLLRKTGFRFSKKWRQAEANTLRGFIFDYVLNTVLANQIADMEWKEFNV